MEGKTPFIMNLLNEECQREWSLTELRRRFLKEDYVHLPGLLTGEAFAFVRAEVSRLEQFARDRKFEMDGYRTPRMMKALGGATIMRESPLAYLYSHFAIRRMIEKIVGSEVYTCLHPNEYMVVNYLLAPGATHGWHMDDPAYALVLFIDAPPCEAGGHLEYIRDWRGLCDERGRPPDVEVDHLAEFCREQNRVKSKYHRAGDAYLLRADQCLHRVTELKAPDARRVVINFAFEATPCPTYGYTANLLYSDAPL